MAAAAPFTEEDLDRVRQMLGTRWNGLRGKRLLVTGGTGFVGKWLLAPLIAAEREHRTGVEVSVLTRRPDAVRQESPWLNDAPCIKLVAGDVRDIERNEALGGEFDHVIHAATAVQTPGSALDTFMTSVEGTRQILELARRGKTKSILLISSGAVYGPLGNGTAAFHEDSSGGPLPFKATSAYAEGKRAAECLAALYAAEQGLAVCVARCFAFVGPHLPLDKHFAIGNFIRDALAGRAIVLRGDGAPLRSYLHASDMSAWLWLLLFEGRRGAAYNVGGDTPIALRELAALVNQLAGSSAGVQLGESPLEGLAPDHYLPDVSRIKTELKLPPPLPLDAAIERTLRWHRRRA